MRPIKVVGKVNKKYPTRSVSVSYNPKSDVMHDLEYKISNCLNDRQKALLQRPVVVKSAVIALSKVVDMNLEEAVEEWVGKPTQDMLEAFDR